MKTSIFKVFLVPCFLIMMNGISRNIQTSKHQDLVKAYIEARNNYNLDAVMALVDENYSEIFSDGSVEIENKNQLSALILWGKELESHIKLLDIVTDEAQVTTIEENSNFLDVALQRKSRKFKVVYSFKDGKILGQKIDTLEGYAEVTKFNGRKYQEFVAYCEKHNLTYSGEALDKDFGIHLRKVLEQYKADQE
ncbi:nuclear transport factor 2 family protein [Winogradskyella arenosi]|nr:nuclear transport factor 2 family protein [Winogradskyella arenosi]